MDATLSNCSELVSAGGEQLEFDLRDFGAADSCGHGGLLYNAAVCLLLGRVYADKDVPERVWSDTAGRPVQWKLSDMAHVAFCPRAEGVEPSSFCASMGRFGPHRLISLI